MFEKFLISEAYFLLTVDNKGQLPIMTNDESMICLVTASLLDLVLADNVSLDSSGNFVTIATLNEELSPLSSLYQFIKDRSPVKPSHIVDAYLDLTKDFSNLFNGIGESLSSKNAVSLQEKNGIFSSKTIYLVIPEVQQELISKLREDILDSKDINEKSLILSGILDSNSQLSKYFSKDERNKYKEKFASVKFTSHAQLSKQLLDNITSAIAIVIPTT